jgi:hypothetical protein
MIEFLNWCLVHWWVFFWLGVFGVFEGVRNFFTGIVTAIGSVGDRRHERRMSELELRARIEGRTAGGVPAPASAVKPGPCVHRNVVPVVSKAEEVVAWLCRTCETRLPADWAIREEDL